MTEWLTQEENDLDRQRKKQMNRKGRIWVMMAMVLCIAVAQSVECIRCPNCEEYIEVEVEAKRIPGAGYRCDNCGLFYVHGSRCPYCGHSKTE